MDKEAADVPVAADGGHKQATWDDPRIPWAGKPRRIEIWFYRFEESIYLSGMPGPRTRDWLANLMADPHFIFHLKHGVVADLPAVATVITDPHERRRILTSFVDDFNYRHGPDGPEAVLDDWVDHSPLARVSFAEAG